MSEAINFFQRIFTLYLKRYASFGLGKRDGHMLDDENVGKSRNKKTDAMHLLTCTHKTISTFRHPSSATCQDEY